MAGAEAPHELRRPAGSKGRDLPVLGGWEDKPEDPMQAAPLADCPPLVFAARHAAARQTHQKPIRSVPLSE